MSTAISETGQQSGHTTLWTGLWPRLLLALALVALLALALWLYLHTLDLPFDRDSYDEGVYWQTLRALGGGHALYVPTFYSQPPVFLLATYPTYMLFGQTLWSARLGIVVLAMLGLPGAFLLGKALHGPIAGLIGLALLMLSPLYLAAAQTIQAEAPQAAFSMLAIAFAYLWWEQPTGWRGLCYATLCTLTLALSIFSKLFGAATLVPIALLALTHIWRIFQHTNRTSPSSPTTYPTTLARGSRFASASSLLAGCIVFLIVTLLILLPFAGVWPAFWSQVITFHIAAKNVSSTIGNGEQIREFLLRSVISYSALYGTVVALWRRDWRVLPLLAWLLTLVYLLWQQAPLFPHHFVVLVPALMGLSLLGFGPGFESVVPRWRSIPRVTLVTGALCLLLVLYTLATDVRADRAHYLQARAQASAGDTLTSLQVARDLQATSRPGELVVTDAQFIAALAQRDTPPDLVDTSNVRIHTGFVTTQEVIQQIQQAQQPRVRAVLFYTGRLQQLPGLHTWVSQHFQRVHTYGAGQELWVS
ncbi:MAG: hypothetical protein NVS2B12_38830 [Ktedonobacteraceae bacterium]